MPEIIEREVSLPPELVGWRFDRAAAALLPDFSRSRLQAWIRDGRLTVNGARRRLRDALAEGDQLRLQVELEAEGEWREAALPLEVVHEDERIIVLDKAVGMVMHPAPGHRDDTVANALLHRYPELAALPRAGLVHRLDRDTGGLLVVARDLAAHASLVRQMQGREVEREYQAVVIGEPVGGVIEGDIGRHPRQRKRMAVLEAGGKPARTRYQVLERFGAHALLRVLLDTGRTHQVRVHMSHIGHPLVGDKLYGARPRLPPSPDEELARRLRAFDRQALHAVRLRLRHPDDEKPRQWRSELPEDMRALLEALRRDASKAV